MKIMKNAIALFLVIALLCTAAPLDGFADIRLPQLKLQNLFSQLAVTDWFTVKASAVTTGTCGENLTWTLDDEGTLTISGTGEMEDYDYGTSPLISDKIKKVVIEEGVKSIGDFAFRSCWKLTSVKIPNSVTRIGTEAFGYCTALQSISIPDNVSLIGGSAFAFCTALKTVTFGQNSKLKSISAHMFEDSALSSIVIPNGVTSIEDQAFWDCAYLTSVTIPESVKSIGNTAFRYCKALTLIKIPASVENIGNSAFHLCSSLIEIEVDPNNESYTSDDGVLFNKNKTELICYPGGKQDTNYNIPCGVETIRENAFYQNINIVAIAVPDSVTSIGDGAFCGCTSLLSINIPTYVTNFNKNSLNNCPALEVITVNDGNTAYCSENGVLYNSGKTTLLYYPQGKKDNTFSIPSTVTAIDEHAFNACPNLKYVYIPDNVTEIGIYAFYNCSSLQSVHFYAGSQVTEIKQWTFMGCSELTSIVIPVSIKNISYQAFLACNKLESVCYLGTKDEGKKIEIISTGNTYIKDATWYYCEDITDTYVNGLVGIQNYEYTYNDNYFFTDATKYNHNLAIMSFCLALSAMLDKETDDNGDEVSLYENQNNYCGEDCCPNDCKVCPEAAKDLFAQLSFQCLQYYGYCKAPTTDSIACVIANKKIGETTIVAIGIRGKGYETEWAGNFTLGTEETHVGFSVAKDKVLKYLSDYIKNNSITGNVKFWISGFSRAAATANLVAATLDDGATGYAEVNKLIYSQNDVYAYTFETPRNTRNPKAKNECYKNIFNILNCIDAVPKVAPAKWEYVRYGNDLYLPSAETKTDYSIYTESLTEIYDRFFTEDNFSLEVLVKGSKASKNSDLVNIVCGNESLGSIWDDLISDLVDSIKTVESYAKNYQNKIRDFIIELSMDDITTDHGIWNGIITILDILQIIEFEDIRQVLSDFDVVKKMHDPLFNFAWVAAVDENALTTEENGSYTAVKLNCPIDVQLYNADGELLAEMVGDEVTIAEDCYMSIFIDSEGQKCFYLPKDGQYSFVITGNGEGTMSCSFSTYDFTSSETTEVVNYYDLPVLPGQEYYVSVDKKLFDGSEADESLANKVVMTNQEEEVIAADEILTEEEAIDLTITIENESENSYAIGGGTYYKGEYVVLSAIAAENETFLGWYMDGELVSNETSYRFRPDADCTIVAKWEVAETEEFTLGDVNADGQITSSDARTTLRAAVGLDELTESQKKAADADKNGEITSADARLILRASVGLENLE